MSVQLNHIIIPAKEKWTSARFLATILNLEAGQQWGPFVPLRTSNGVTIDFVDAMDFEPHHCAFLVNEEEFEAALARLHDHDVVFYADFVRKKWARSTISTAAGAFTSTTPQAICLS